MIDLTPTFIAEHEQLQREFDQLRTSVAALEAEAERLRRERQDLGGERDRLQGQLQRAERELQAARRELHESTTQIERLQLQKSPPTAQPWAVRETIPALPAAAAASTQGPVLPAPGEESVEGTVPPRRLDVPLLRCPHCHKFMLSDGGDASAPLTCLFCGGAIA
jgi:hypothetical protein